MSCLYIRPTFVRIYKRKSSEGYQSIPYVIGLFSAMLWIYYAMIKKNAMILITINVISFVMQIFYISFYLFYAPKKEKVPILYEHNLFVLYIHKNYHIFNGTVCFDIAESNCEVFPTCGCVCVRRNLPPDILSVSWQQTSSSPWIHLHGLCSLCFRCTPWHHCKSLFVIYLPN